MSIDWVVGFAVVMGIVAFVAGLINCVQLLRQARTGEKPVPVGTQLGAVLLVGIGGGLVATAMVTAAHVKDREADANVLRGEVNSLQAKSTVYEHGLARLEKALDAAKGSRASADKLAADLRQELIELRQQRAGVR
jgi:hypothetical protein